MGKLVLIKFRYKDEYSHKKWNYQQCICNGVEECIKFYGLDECEYEILSIEPLVEGR